MIMKFIKSIIRIKNFILDTSPIKVPDMHFLCKKCDGLGLSDFMTECDDCEGIGHIKTPYKKYLDSLK